MKTNAWLCLMSLAAASSVSADEVGRWYVTPQGGGLVTDDDRHIEDGDGLFGLSVGKHVSQHWSLELNVNGAKLDAFDPYAASLDLLRVFRRNERLSPYLTFGAGAVRNDERTTPDTTDFITQAGVGLLWKLGENSSGTRSFSLRPEIKARWDDVGRGGHFTDYIATLGFQLAFGGSPPAPAAVVPSAPPPAAPAPAPAPVAAAPADSDEDGVLDPADRCPGTPRGVAVDGAGCPQQGEITLVGVGFETNSATLTASRSLLDPVATNLKKYPDLQIELQGHTDSVGADQYNQRLSQQRAESVREYLLAQGVSATQVIARGYGESQPIASNATPEGRAQNRRVVMKVLRNPGSVRINGDGER